MTHGISRSTPHQSMALTANILFEYEANTLARHRPVKLLWAEKTVRRLTDVAPPPNSSFLRIMNRK